MALLPTAGCGGCGGASAPSAGTQTATQREAEEKKQKEADEAAKRPLVVEPLAPVLSEGLISPTGQGALRLAKPGHWTATAQRMTATADNVEGRTAVAVVNSRGRTLALPETPFALVSSRPAVLAKGRTKRVLSEVLPPAAEGRLRVRSSLSAGGSVLDEREDRWTLMPSHQYFMLVLAREPARYAFLKVADSVRAPYETDHGDAGPPHYRVVLLDGAKAAPLPTNPIAWTSVAYVVWDQADVTRLLPEQQQALVDWLHWGGRLIISGPDSLRNLRGTFLDKYLPVDGGTAIAIDSPDLAPFSDAWSVRSEGKSPPPLGATKPWSGVELSPRRSVGQALPGAEGLFYEGPVGGGSIVVSAMQLAERDLVNWGGFDGFLNGGLLRRPPRRFRDEHEGLVVGLQTVWADSAYADRTRDAHFTTPLRWFSRDAGVAANARFVTPVVPLTPSVPWQGQGQLIPETRLEVDRPGGLGAWDEFNPASQAAREALRTAAGVRVPGASFVVVCLAVYLVILVPLNWMLFKALERVEWAWLAAPVIALAATVAVVRQAQLDIGFVRSQTEIAVLEMQGDLPRGHLSRYTALYSSLSTTYNAEFASQNAVAAPFPVDSARTNAPLQVADAEVLFEKYDQPRLRGIPVTSASTQLLHSEEIVPLSGSLRLSSPPSNPRALQLENATGLALSDAVVVHRFERGGRWALETCWLGRIESGQSHYLPWTPEEPEGDQLIYAAERAKAASVDYRKRLDVNALLKLALKFPPASDPFYGRREEYRLVARIDEPLPGAVTDPAASQTTGTTVVLAHLRYGLPPHPAPDVNSRTDVPTRESPELDAN